MTTLGAYRRWRLGLLMAAVLGAFLGCGALAERAAGFTRAFTDDVWFTTGSQEPAWVHRTAATGAGLVLLEVDWEGLEGMRPSSGADPSNPAAPWFNFSDLDHRISEFTGSGLSVALLITDAPQWAEAPGGPTDLEAAGAWKPDPTALGQFAQALARRYSGTYPDPAHPGQLLPRVKYYQAWAEANFSVHLAPQWVRQGGRLVPFAPVWYRGMLNAFYAGVKSAHSDNVVVTTGFGPYGDPQGVCPRSEVGNGCRMHPVEFERDLLCLRGQRLIPQSCANPAHFDALAMDPYEIAGPLQHAFNVDDVSAPDLGKLTRVLKKAVKTGRAVPHRHKQLWVTEFSYDSNPPNPTGVSAATQARWLEEAFFLFWRQGASVAVWYLVSDQPGRNFGSSYYSGVYFNNGSPKPSYQAYRFPFVLMPAGRRQMFWGLAPHSGTLAVQRRRGRRWTTLFTVHVKAGGVFTRMAAASLRGSFRAEVGGDSSVVWRR